MGVKAPKMVRHGKRLYCHDMDEDQQKWIIDQLSRKVSLVIPSAIGPVAVEAVVRSTKGDKAILTIRAIRTPTENEVRKFVEQNKDDDA